MKRTVFSGLALGALVIAGCAPGPSTVAKPAPATAPTPTPSATHATRRLIVFIPLNETSAISALKLLERSPNLRLTIAMAPRFQSFKEPALKGRVNALVLSHRLEIGLQLPNPPIIPLLIDSNSGKESLPPGSALPVPAFAYPEDVVQIIARAKADFFRVWGALPHGIVLPYGAASPASLALLDRQGFTWTVAALGVSGGDGVYRSGALLVWDALAKSTAGTTVLVYDERATREGAKALPTLESWSAGLTPAGPPATLPSDPGGTPRALGEPFARRSWTQPDWRAWIGSGAQNAAWQALRRTREALENYKNSGSAALSRLDMAFEEIYQAESATYFALPLDLDASPAAQEKLHEFQARLSTVFRLMGKPAPEDLFATARPNTTDLPHLSSTTATAEDRPDGSERVLFTDAAGDDHGDGKLPEPPGPHVPGAYDLRAFEIVATSDTLTWSVTLGASGSALIDLYVDLNRQPGLGTTTLLPDRQLTAAAGDAWEYALTVSGTHATLYRTTSEETFDVVGSFPVMTEGTTFKIVMPRTTIHGKPRKWGFQVLVMARDPASSEANPRPWMPPKFKGPPVYDLLDPLDTPQATLLSDLESGTRSDLPFVHVSR